MKSVLQRVSQASITVSGQVVGEIGRGILVLLGFAKGDDASKLDYQIDKLLKLRIFPDEADKMNLSVTDVQGELLIVSQFTLAADCQKGTRPSFDSALPPAEAKTLYDEYLVRLRNKTPLHIATGQFGAMMKVSLINDGPVTLILEN